MRLNFFLPLAPTFKTFSAMDRAAGLMVFWLQLVSFHRNRRNVQRPWMGHWWPEDFSETVLVASGLVLKKILNRQHLQRLENYLDDTLTYHFHFSAVKYSAAERINSLTMYCQSCVEGLYSLEPSHVLINGINVESLQVYSIRANLSYNAKTSCPKTIGPLDLWLSWS